METPKGIRYSMIPPIVNFQKQAVETTKRAVAHDRLGHAYLLVGEAGCGISETAESISQTILCSSPMDGWACGQCPSCRKFLSGNHPDFLRIPPGERYIKLEEVRALKKESALNPFERMQRVILMEEAERMNQESANSFLKLLEEPPASTVILLTTAKPGLLPETVISRLLIIYLKRPPAKVIAEQLVFEGLAEERADYISKKSGGSLEKARQLIKEPTAEENAEEVERRTLNELTNLGTIDGAVQAAQSWGRDRQAVLQNLEQLAGFMESNLTRFAGKDSRAIESAMQEIIFTRQAISQNANIELCLLDLFIGLGETGIPHLLTKH
jgi:DNA polymerase III delta' subunit